MLAINTPSTEINNYHISRKNVKAALNSLLYSTGLPKPNPLENIVLVQQLASDPATLLGSHNSGYALHLLLTSIIAEELARHRRALAIPVEDGQTLTDVRNAIIRDTRAVNPELMSWSWLYYRFVRVEFNISAKDFSQMAFIEERTLRRYQNHAIWRLTQYLMAREHLVRQTLSNTFLPTAFYPTAV
jgi:hypothetical protein